MAAEVFDAWRVPPGDPARQVRSDLELVTGELAANAVRFCRSGFSVSLEAHRDHVMLTVQDDGPATEGLFIAPKVPSPDAESGRGLLIVAAIASRWGTAGEVTSASDGGTRVWARIEFDDSSSYLGQECRFAQPVASGARDLRSPER
jgi:two-component sensor histidine kinase